MSPGSLTAMSGRTGGRRNENHNRRSYRNAVHSLQARVHGWVGGRFPARNREHSGLGARKQPAQRGSGCAGTQAARQGPERLLRRYSQRTDPHRRSLERLSSEDRQDSYRQRGDICARVRRSLMKLQVLTWTPSRYAKWKECPAKVKYEDLMKMCPVCFKGRVSGGYDGEPVVCDVCDKPQPERPALDRGN